ncbi:MAG: hypothetical protein GY792_09365 [Gammaproteobacteria bacterium]|nr:hypothetical protein [Gammaproteobacteria bacterium]
MLDPAAGPWHQTLVDRLYREAFDLHAGSVWEQVGTLSDWLDAELTPENIIRRFQTRVRPALSVGVEISVDQALVRQLPDEKSQADWFTGLIDQACPYWRYDETMLAESARAQVRLETWLLLPDAENSPLRHLGQHQARPPRLLSGNRLEDLGVITVRQIQYEPEEISQTTPAEWQIEAWKED